MPLIQAATLLSISTPKNESSVCTEGQSAQPVYEKIVKSWLKRHAYYYYYLDYILSNNGFLSSFYPQTDYEQMRWHNETSDVERNLQMFVSSINITPTVDPLLVRPAF